MNSITALLPLKANSTRVPRKNFRSFCGKPLYRWMLDTLLSLKEIDQIVINTDARQDLIALGLPDDSRVVIRDRRAQICGDDVSMNRIIEDDIASIQSDTYLMTHTTNPLLESVTIRNAMATYYDERDKNRHDSLFTVNRIQTRFYRKDGIPVNHDPKDLIPTQNLEPWFEENSNLYIFSKNSFQATGNRIGQNPFLYESPPLTSMDIDTEKDWAMATAMQKITEGSTNQ